MAGHELLRSVEPESLSLFRTRSRLQHCFQRTKRRLRQASMMTSQDIRRNRLLITIPAIFLLAAFVITIPCVVFFRRYQGADSLTEIKEIDAIVAKETLPSGFLVFCLLNLSRFSLPDALQYTALDVPANYCSHIIFPLTQLSEWFTDMVRARPLNNIPQQNFCRRMIHFKRRYGLKVLTSIGTHEDNALFLHSLVSIPEKRQQFVAELKRWTASNDLDGVALEGMFPTNRDNRNDMIRFLKDLNRMYRPKYMVLVLLYSHDTRIFSNGHSRENLAVYLDYIVVLTHGLMNLTVPVVGTNTSLSAHKDSRSLPSAVSLVLDSNFPSQKILMSVSFDGLQFVLKEHTFKRTVLDQPLSFSNRIEVLPYMDICQKVISEYWEKVFDYQTGCPYAYADYRWVAYEDEHSLRIKMAVVKSNLLAGVMVWDLTSDDYKGLCGERNILTKTIHEELSDYDFKEDGVYLRFS